MEICKKNDFRPFSGTLQQKKLFYKNGKKLQPSIKSKEVPKNLMPQYSNPKLPNIVTFKMLPRQVHSLGRYFPP